MKRRLRLSDYAAVLVALEAAQHVVVFTGSCPRSDLQQNAGIPSTPRGFRPAPRRGASSPGAYATDRDAPASPVRTPPAHLAQSVRGRVLAPVRARRSGHKAA